MQPKCQHPQYHCWGGESGVICDGDADPLVESQAVVVVVCKQSFTTLEAAVLTPLPFCLPPVLICLLEPQSKTRPSPTTHTSALQAS